MKNLKSIPELKDYLCDDHGNVYSNKTGTPTLMKQTTGSKGYMRVTLSLGSRKNRKDALVHRLIASAWIVKPNGYNEINHINGVKSDNRVSNLEWSTRLLNERHSWDVLGKNTRGENHALSKITNKNAVEIRKLRNDGWTLKKIAEKFSLGISSIHRVVKKQSWRHA